MRPASRRTDADWFDEAGERTEHALTGKTGLQHLRDADPAEIECALAAEAPPMRPPSTTSAMLSRETPPVGSCPAPRRTSPRPEHEAVVADEVEFLRRHLLDAGGAD